VKHRIAVELSGPDVEEAIRSFIIRKLEADGVTPKDRTVFVTEISQVYEDGDFMGRYTAVAEVQP